MARWTAATDPTEIPDIRDLPGLGHLGYQNDSPEAQIRRGVLSQGWQRYVFPGFWLIYLAQTVAGVNKYSHGAAAVLGYVIVGLFAVVYLISLPAGWGGHTKRFWSLFGFGVVLMLAELPLAHQSAVVFNVYLGVLAVASFNRFALHIVGALVAITVLVPGLTPSWHSSVDVADGVVVALVAFAMFGFFKIIRSNIALSEARAEVARLAAENERSRIARDLHDLLGHSLTTITVKASLAHRLAELDPARAAQEISEVEELARRALTDVRAAVSGYREVTLIGELASAREVLRAAGVEATLPASVDTVDARLNELFGWVTREGVTNIVRHSRAAHCHITLGINWIQIEDDGRGGVIEPTGRTDRTDRTVKSGNGLCGLKERVEAMGGQVQLGSPASLSGFRLRVDVPLHTGLGRETDEPLGRPVVGGRV